MDQFIIEHPWMTFFIALGALHSIRVLIRGYPPTPPTDSD